MMNRILPQAVLLVVVVALYGCEHSDSSFTPETTALARANALDAIQEFEAMTPEKKAIFMRQMGPRAVLNKIKVGGDDALKQRYIKDLKEAQAAKVPVASQDPGSSAVRAIPDKLGTQGGGNR